MKQGNKQKQTTVKDNHSNNRKPAIRTKKDDVKHNKHSKKQVKEQHKPADDLPNDNVETERKNKNRRDRKQEKAKPELSVTESVPPIQRIDQVETAQHMLQQKPSSFSGSSFHSSPNANTLPRPPFKSSPPRSSSKQSLEPNVPYVQMQNMHMAPPMQPIPPMFMPYPVPYMYPMYPPRPH